MMWTGLGTPAVGPLQPHGLTMLYFSGIKWVVMIKGNSFPLSMEAP